MENESIEKSSSDNQAVLAPDFYLHVKDILTTARHSAYRAANFAMVKAYWEIGRSIVEQQGGKRAEYGRRLVAELSERLTEDFGKGFDESNLRYMRLFYLAFPIRDALRHELSWTHYRRLSKVENPEARIWYMNECADANWSTRQLERQINTMFRERLLATKEEYRPGVAAEIQTTEPGSMQPEDIIRDPYVLEFLGLNQNTRFYESELEDSLISHLQEFLLELGNGFALVARQKRITLDGDSFYIDLVFYNYLARCFVLIDLKTGKLTHQDIGQMQMYVNYYTRELMNPDDNPPIGLLLCAEKNDAVVRYTLPDDNRQILAAKYLTHLPTEEELAREISAEYRALTEAHGGSEESAQ